MLLLCVFVLPFGVFGMNYRRIRSNYLEDEHLVDCTLYAADSLPDLVQCGRMCNDHKCVHFNGQDSNCNLCIDNNHLSGITWDSAALENGVDVFIKANYVNECESNPCQNGGSCNDREERFYCACVDGWTDTSCETDLNECDTSNGGCGQTCSNSVGSYSCSCNTGYLLNGDQHACDDNNECASNNGGCAHQCHNNVGSYTCSCNSGYYLDGDQHNCLDNNECALNNGGCVHQCHNNVGSYTCSCNAGYYLDGGQRSCNDNNECASNNGGCSHHCHNNVGSYTCSCNAGYYLHGNQHTCYDTNECASNPCQNGATCNNNVNYWSCSCATGYSGTYCQTFTEFLVLSASYARLVRQSNMDANAWGGLFGRLEILNYVNGYWGTVCDDIFDANDAIVACRMMGRSYYSGSQGIATGPESLPIVMDDLACSGGESNLWECGFAGWNNHDCGHGEDVAIACY